MLLVVARLIDVQVIHSGSYQAAALNESHEADHAGFAARRHLRPRRVAPRSLGAHRRRHRRRLPDRASGARRRPHCRRCWASRPPRWLRSSIGIPATSCWPHSSRRATVRRSPPTPSPGITLVADSKRVVTNGNLASPVLGFTNASNNGAAGIEYAYNRQLAGTAGKETLIESPSGVALPESTVAEPRRQQAGPGTRADPRYAAPVRIGAGPGPGDRVLAGPERDGHRHGRQDGPDPLHGQSGLDPSQRTGVAHAPDGREHGRRRHPDRPEGRGERGPEQHRRDAALRARFGLQAGHVLGRAPGRAHQSEHRLHGAGPDHAGRLARSTTPNRTRRRGSRPPRFWPSPPTSGRPRSPRASGSSACWPRSGTWDSASPPVSTSPASRPD